AAGNFARDLIGNDVGEDGNSRAVSQYQEEKQAIGAAEFVEGDDVWMVQFCERPGLAGESFRESGVVIDARGQDLQGDDSIEFLLANLIDRTHAAAAEEFKDLELGKSVFEFPRRGRSVARGTTGRVS